MRRASIDELRDHASELVSAAKEGEIIVIERDGEAVAELGPATGAEVKKNAPFPDMTELWARMPDMVGDSGKYLEEDR
jgi:antitoxin (DNA-binding transcriptional repressor) of toxin-antitoxin stability system